MESFNFGELIFIIFLNIFAFILMLFGIVQLTGFAFIAVLVGTIVLILNIVIIPLIYFLDKNKL